MVGDDIITSMLEYIRGLMNEPKASYREILRNLSHNFTYEIFPMQEQPSMEMLSRFLPGTKVAISSWWKKGPDRTMAWTKEAQNLRLDVAPNVAARSVVNEEKLQEFGAVIKVTDKALIVGGDNLKPEGPWDSSLGLMEKLAELNLLPKSIGVAGYPEGNPKIPDEVLIRELIAKQEFAKKHNIEMYITTQICLSATKIINWVKKIRGLRIDLPVVVGIPGTANLERLIRFFEEFGFADSIQALKDKKKLVFTMGVGAVFGFKPDLIVRSLAKKIAGGPADLNIIGLRAFTFNDLDESFRLHNDILNQD